MMVTCPVNGANSYGDKQYVLRFLPSLLFSLESVLSTMYAYDIIIFILRDVANN